MSGEIAFGVGCFHLAPTADAERTTLRGFLRFVGEELERSDAVEDGVVIDFDESEGDSPVDGSGSSEMSDGEEPYPNPAAGRIGFVLRVPVPRQEELFGPYPLPLPAARFAVEIRYGYWMPCTYVRPLDPEDTVAHPSNAVILARRAIQQICSGTDLDFQCLGPSPLHADLFLTSDPPEEADEGQWESGFNLAVVETRGYSQYLFGYSPLVFPDGDDAYLTLLDALSEELDFYYRLVAADVRSIRGTAQLDSLLWRAVELHRTRGVKGAFARLRRSTSAINDASIALAEYEGTALREASAFQREYRDVYASDERAYLGLLVDAQLADVTPYPAEQTRSLLSLFETRRLSGHEVSALVLSAVVGGVIGALITAALG